MLPRPLLKVLSETKGPSSENWIRFFKFLLMDVEAPEIIWNDSTRRELTFWISEELATFDNERVIHSQVSTT